MGFTLTSDEAPWHRRYAALGRPLEPEFSDPWVQRGFVWHVVSMMAAASARPPSSDGWVSEDFMDIICGPQLVKVTLKVGRRAGLIKPGMHFHPHDGRGLGKGYLVETQHDDKLLNAETREQARIRNENRGRAGRQSVELTWRVILRDGDTCRYCACPVDAYDTANPHRQRCIDHVDPDGGDDVTNCVVCCRSCNSRKGTEVWKPNDEPENPRYNPGTLKTLIKRGLLISRPAVDSPTTRPADDYLDPVDSRLARPGVDSRDALTEPTTAIGANRSETARAIGSLGRDGPGGVGLGGAGPGRSRGGRRRRVP